MSRDPARLLASFVDHFKRAITLEMAAMRERRGSFEVFLADGAETGSDASGEGTRYSFKLASTDEKLVRGMECTLRILGGEHLVRVEELDGQSVTLWTSREIELGGGQGILVIYPWFLYERLRAILDEIDEERYSVDRAMALFGKLPATRTGLGMLRAHEDLNPSQRAAVQLCCDSDVAFVWGPPGTGKTTTLAHIVDELAAQGLRLLVVSTTNAALDQALERIAKVPATAAVIAAGKVVRIGRTEAPTIGTDPAGLVARLNAGHQARLDRLWARRPAVDCAWQACRRALDELSKAEELTQGSLFGGAEASSRAPDLSGIFSEGRLAVLRGRPRAELLGIASRRAERLGRLRDLYPKRIAEVKEALAKKERGVVSNAAVVMATLTNAYFSPLMGGQRFDAVIVEEASMAVLPALFYAACLGRRKTVVVGDPCQLPSIVQSDEPYVRQVMGRNIFEVAVPDPVGSPLVAMLDVQYRMHPKIRELVSELFYFGLLKDGGDAGACERIAALDPYPGAALVVLDTALSTTCEQGPRGQSRRNLKTAEAAVALALRAAGSVAIITPYVDQVRTIRALLSEEDAARIECSTVHRFQGQERDVVILDTVDAEPLRPGVLLSERGSKTSAQNLVNVAVSRARGKLVIIADVSYFKRRAPDGVITKVIARALALGRRALLPCSMFPGF